MAAGSTATASSTARSVAAGPQAAARLCHNRRRRTANQRAVVITRPLYFSAKADFSTGASAGRKPTRTGRCQNSPARSAHANPGSRRLTTGMGPLTNRLNPFFGSIGQHPHRNRQSPEDSNHHLQLFRACGLRHTQQRRLHPPLAAPCIAQLSRRRMPERQATTEESPRHMM